MRAGHHPFLIGGRHPRRPILFALSTCRRSTEYLNAEDDPSFLPTVTSWRRVYNGSTVRRSFTAFSVSARCGSSPARCRSLAVMAAHAVDRERSSTSFDHVKRPVSASRYELPGSNSPYVRSNSRALRGRRRPRRSSRTPRPTGCRSRRDGFRRCATTPLARMRRMRSSPRRSYDPIRTPVPPTPPTATAPRVLAPLRRNRFPRVRVPSGVALEAW